jgi:serine/threonine protein kinase
MALKKSTESMYASKEVVDEIYEREGRILKIARDLGHDHVIEVNTSFQCGDVRCFVFPWAGKGNLRQFWETERPGAPDANALLWFLNQMEGVTDALKILHQKYHFRHGDLKLENLLVYNQPGSRGRLVIDDLGLAKIHSVPTTERLAITMTMSGTHKYGPPDELNKSLPRSRFYDVWSMGCICLEFLIWLYWGWDGLNSFHRLPLSTFWHADEGAQSSTEAEVDPQVIRTFNVLRDVATTSKERTLLGDLIDLIESQLFVVEIKPHNDSKLDLSNVNFPVNSMQYRAGSHEMYKNICEMRERATAGGSTYLLASTKLQRPGSFSIKSRSPTPHHSRIASLEGNRFLGSELRKELQLRTQKPFQSNTESFPDKFVMTSVRGFDACEEFRNKAHDLIHNRATMTK